MTSVARLMPSMKLWRQPRLSNFDLVTESLTLIAGNSSSPASIIWYSRCTPVVVSSETPLIPGAIAEEGRVVGENCDNAREHAPLLRIVLVGLGHRACLLELKTLVHEHGGVAAVVEDQVGTATVRPAEQLLGRPPVLLVSPFQANTGVPDGASIVPPGPTATAAAAWSWVEKMLHETQRTSALGSTRVSISTAVCTVMCSEPAMRARRAAAHRRTCLAGPSGRASCSARVISLRPNPASSMSATLKSEVDSATVCSLCSSGSRPKCVHRARARSALVRSGPGSADTISEQPRPCSVRAEVHPGSIDGSASSQFDDPVTSGEPGRCTKLERERTGIDRTVGAQQDRRARDGRRTVEIEPSSKNSGTGVS